MSSQFDSQYFRIVFEKIFIPLKFTQIYAHLSEEATRRAVDLMKFKPKDAAYLRTISIINGEIKTVAEKKH